MPLTLLDYGEPNPFGETIGRPRHLAWPVSVYRVTMPKTSDESDHLNAFERVILKLIDAGGTYDAEMLAMETCIPKALVQCLLLRLRDKSYIDEYNQITDHHHDDWAKHEHSQPTFVTALSFRELATGKILPYLHILNDDKPLKIKEEGKRVYQRVRRDEAHRHCPPTPTNVISALQGMHKRSMAFGNQLRLPSVQLVTIAGTEAELYSLDCPIAIQKSDGEFRIADPFGNGFSLVLENAFRRVLEQDAKLSAWLLEWRESLSNRGQESRVENEPYDTDVNRGRYRNLISNLGRRSSIERIHAAIEWALFYSCLQWPYPSAVQQLKLTNQSEHPALLQRAAEELSLSSPPEGFFSVRERKIDAFLEGKAELDTVLSLSLLLAAGDVAHPLRRIAAAHPDFIFRVLEIKKKRNELGHGTGRVRSNDGELPEEAFLREVVTTLLPGIRFSHASASESALDGQTLSDALLDARTSIQNEFGFALFNRLGNNLQDRLIVAERFWLSCEDGNNAIAFACDLYAALQSAFRRSLSGALPPEVRDREYVANAQEKAETHGLGDLPECLRTVKRSAIRETLLGNDQTLQSCIVAFLLVSSADVLYAIAQTHPSFIADVARVIEHRGHGNEPLPLQKNEICTLRKAALTSIKTLLEV